MTNSQHGFAPILIVLLIIAGAAVAGGGYYVVAKRSEANNAKVAQSAKSVAPVAPTSPTPSPSASATPSTSAKPRASVSASTKPSPSSTPQNNVAGVKIYEPVSGWPIKLSSTIPIKGSIESLPGMVVLRLYPITQVPGEYTLTVSGFPVSTDLYIYTNGYRELEVKRSSAPGTLVFTPSSAIPKQWIIEDHKE